MVKRTATTRRNRPRTRRTAALRGWPRPALVGAASILALGALSAVFAQSLIGPNPSTVAVETTASIPEPQTALPVAPPNPQPRVRLAQAEAAVVDHDPENPFIGEWRGAGWVSRSNGAREQLNCRASHRVREEGEHTIHVLRCANERFQIDLTSGLTHREEKISGWWRESTHNRRGWLSGTQNGDKLNLFMRGEHMTASLHATVNGCRQSIGIRITEDRDRKGYVSLKKVGC